MTFIASIYADMTTVEKLLFTIGLLWSLWLVIAVIRTAVYYFGCSSANMVDRYGRDSYALITGCTEGIGKAFAQALAKRGFNLVLVSRNQEKLDKVKDEVTETHKVKVRTVSIDFTKLEGFSRYERLAEEVADLDVSILVNNVGIDVVDRFDELPESTLRNLFLTNLNPTTFIQRFFLKRLAARERSAVVTVSSIAGRVPVHHMNAYSGTKAFGKMLSDCNVREYKNVDFIACCPGKVSTAMNDYKTPDLFMVTADQAVEGFLNDLMRGYTVTDGHLSHKINSSLMRNLYPIFAFIWENFQLAVMRKERNLPPPKIF